MKHVTILGAIVFAVFGGVVNGAIVTVPDFSFFCNTSLGSRSIRMATGDNLMIRDSVTGVDSVVSTEGYWNMGFLSDETGMVGWARNNGKTSPGFEGWMAGYYYADLGVGNRPDEVYLIHDVLGDGIGFYDSSNGSWTLGDDDVFYAYDFWGGVFDASQNILFGQNQIRGDLSTLPAFEGATTVYLPSMIVDVLSSDLNDLILLAEYWLCNCSDFEQGSEEYILCSEADWDGEGNVNLVDFSILASRWFK